MSDTKSMFLQWIRGSFSGGLKASRWSASKGWMRNRAADDWAKRTKDIRDTYNKLNREKEGAFGTGIGGDTGFDKVTGSEAKQMHRMLQKAAEKGADTSGLSTTDILDLARDPDIKSQKHLEERLRQRTETRMREQQDREMLKEWGIDPDKGAGSDFVDQVNKNMEALQKGELSPKQKQTGGESYAPTHMPEGGPPDDYRKAPQTGGADVSNKKGGGGGGIEPSGTANSLTIWDDDGALSSLAGSDKGDLVYFTGSAWAKLAAPTGTSKTYFLSATTDGSGDVTSLSWVEGYECS